MQLGRPTDTVGSFGSFGTFGTFGTTGVLYRTPDNTHFLYPIHIQLGFDLGLIPYQVRIY